MEPIKIYLACHTSSFHESEMRTISTHRTRDGAQNAIDKHKSARFNEHRENYKILYQKDPEYHITEKIMECETWEIVEGELLE